MVVIVKRFIRIYKICLRYIKYNTQVSQPYLYKLFNKITYTDGNAENENFPENLLSIEFFYYFNVLKQFHNYWAPSMKHPVSTVKM